MKPILKLFSIQNLFSLLLLSIVFSSIAVDTTYTFDTPVLQKRYLSLTEQLRCPKCQNQNLADSNAMIATDLKKEVYEQLLDGKTDTQIIDYMVYRYGDYVRYKPKFDGVTYILWFGPILFMSMGALVIYSLVKRHRTEKADLT